MSIPRILLTLVCLLTMLALAGCDDDDGATDPTSEVTLDRLSPADGDGVAREPVLQWQADDPAGLVEEFAVVLDTLAVPETEVYRGPETQTQVGGLDPWLRYRWRVTAHGADGETLAESAVVSFITGIDLTAVNPGAGAAGVRPNCRFAWVAAKDGGAGIASYEVRLGTDPAELSVIHEGADRAFWWSGLAIDTTYHWSVTAVDAEGARFTAGPWSFATTPEPAAPPALAFTLDIGGGPMAMAPYDTVPYGAPFELAWQGEAPAAAFYAADELAEIDTVGAADGLLGYQWALPDQAGEPAWRPRVYDEATGDSVSVFGPVTSLFFLNDGSGPGWLARRLESGVLEVGVNAMDVEGGEVDDPFVDLVINHDPDTYLLDGEVDPVAEHNDPLVYPRYYVYHGPEQGWYTFTSGDTVPDGAYVLLKALGRDDERDERAHYPENRTRFQGRFLAGQHLHGDGAWFPFGTTFSDLHRTPEWTADETTGLSADTLGFVVGPFAYDVVMRAVDEHDRRDGTPDTLSFVGNFPPCVQCIELGGPDLVPDAAYGDVTGDNCYDASCLDTEAAVAAYPTGDPRYDPSDPTQLAALPVVATLWIEPDAGAVTREDPGDDAWLGLPVARYRMLVYLHGRDHPREYWAPSDPAPRVKAWRYQIDYEADPANALQDGPGLDDLDRVLGFPVMQNEPDPWSSPLFIDDLGAWGLQVMVDVPLVLQIAGDASYWGYLLQVLGCPAFPEGGTDDEILAWQADPDVQRARRVWDVSRVQLTPGMVRAIALDQPACEHWYALGAYHYYDGTRVPPVQGRSCQEGLYEVPPGPDDPTGILELGSLALEDFAAASNDGDAVARCFRIEAYGVGAAEPLSGGTAPPGWLSQR